MINRAEGSDEDLFERKPSINATREDITVEEESKPSTLTCNNDSSLYYNIPNDSHLERYLSRRPSNQTNSTSSSMIHPIHAKPHPIYGRRDTIFTFEQIETSPPNHNENDGNNNQQEVKNMIEKEQPKRKLLFGYCSRGVRISHVLLLVFIIQGLIGLIPSFLLMYSSGNSILDKVSKFQAQQTQIYVNLEISKISNTSMLVLQHIRFELANGLSLRDLKLWATFIIYLRSIYSPISPLTAIQFANFRDNYVGMLDSPTLYPPVIEYLNGTGDWIYRFRIENDNMEDPLSDQHLYNSNFFTFSPTKRPWYIPFLLSNHTEQRWSDIYVSTFGTISTNNVMPIYVHENITAAVLEGKSMDGMDLRVWNTRHPDHLYGVFGALFAIKGLNSFLNSTSNQYNFISYSFIMQGNGSVIASSRQNNTEKLSIEEEDPEIIEVASYINRKGIFKNNTIPDREYFFKFRGKNVVITPVTDNGLAWAIVIGANDPDIFRELLSSGMTSVVVFIIILVAGSLVLFVVVQLFTQPLNYVHKKLSTILTDKNLSKEIVNPKITAAGMLFFDIGEMENGINSLKRGVSAFSKFISPPIMKKIIKDEHYLDVGMTIQNMTILVSNICDFTQLAEQTETSVFVSIMTDFFGNLTKVMEDHRGLIDMITGERLQVVWNDSSMPIEEHEVRACKAAMEAFEIVEELNCMWRSEKKMDMDLSVSMSVSSGNMMYGSIGSEHRLNFTAIGDDVNVGSKLSTLNGYYGTKILISDNTFQHVKKEFVCYFVDYIILNGKETPTIIYSLESHRNNATDLQIKVSKDLELVRDYMFQNNYRSMYDICERLELISASKIINNLLLKAKRKITTH